MRVNDRQPGTVVRIKTYWKNSGDKEVAEANSKIENIVNSLLISGMDKDTIERSLSFILDVQYTHGYDEGASDVILNYDDPRWEE